MNEIRVSYEQITSLLSGILISMGFPDRKAALSADLFVKSSLDGVPSHGLNRFPVFVDYIRKGLVIPEAEPSLISQFSAFEQWNGNAGPGNCNAYGAMDRAIDLSRKFGIGCVTLKNTNHWMRAGNYGWQAVDHGCLGLCFTNTKPNMPAWGGVEPKLGNNPLVIGIPRSSGPVVLDMAMSQFAYGKMAIYARNGKEMPYDAGLTPEGQLSRNPGQIIADELALPMGLWKGAGLSLLIDMLTVVLSGGNSTSEIGQLGEETGLSQVFISLDPLVMGLGEDWDQHLDRIIEDLLGSRTPSDSGNVRYPGQNTLQTREENMRLGVPIEIDIWKKIQQLADEKDK
ncbi:3-dehydro-L-gulonate 2-dehydrogenase [Echinicola pacifica]|nr:3-dehydro-L-gulonate 2-dehydrogenase [Echinicola pacifica]